MEKSVLILLAIVAVVAVLAIVLVGGLVVVYLVGGFAGMDVGTMETQSQQYWAASAPFR